jgi:hypothetical protein
MEGFVAIARTVLGAERYRRLLTDGEGRMNRISRFWSETAPSARWVTYVAVPLGIFTAVLGLIGDSHGWWEHRAFLTNLLSSTTSVLFGIPTALIVLSWLGTHQAEVLERRAALRRARQAVDDLRETLLRNLAFSDPDAARREVATLKRRNSARAAVLGSLAHNQAAPVSEETKNRWREAQQGWERAADAYFVDRRPGMLAEWSGDIDLAWRTLDEEVRPRLASLGVRWIPSTLYRELQGVMEQWPKTPRAFFPGHPASVEEVIDSTPWEQLGGVLLPTRSQVSGTDKTLRALSVLLSAVDDLGRIGA